MDTEALLTYDDLQKLFGCSRRSVFLRARKGEIPAGLRIGRHRRWRASEIMDFLQRHESQKLEAGEASR
jgi:predicted DNA-binding transcriptional regulator AlpA